jgi:hypothetical protein
MIKQLTAVAAALGAALALAGVSAASASENPPVTRIVIYAGAAIGDNGIKTQYGPPGPLAVKWTVWDEPSVITVTNGDTLVENPSLTYAGFNPGGEWVYDTGQAVDHAFDWDQPGQDEREGYSLASVLNGFSNPNEWDYLGDGTWTPVCLDWSTPEGGSWWIHLSMSTYTWSPASPSCVPSPS